MKPAIILFLFCLFKSYLFSENIIEVSLTGEECEDTLTYLNKYIDDSDFDLDKDIVKNLMREVYREACEME